MLRERAGDAVQGRFIAPAGSCDTHLHVFGAEARYPINKAARYPLPTGTLTDYLSVAQDIGVTRYVFVQPGIYGGDNSCLLDALREVGPERGRAIAGWPETVADSALQEWHRLGVRGFRVNFTPVAPYDPALADAAMPRISEVAARARELGWTIDLLAPFWLVMELLPRLERLGVDFTLAHFAKFAASQGPDHPDFRRLVESFAQSARCWMKICGPYQVSDAADFADVRPLAEALVGAAPERILWGSDWPHNLFEDRAETGELLDFFALCVPDQALRRRILIDHPERLYGFPRPN